MEGLYVGIAAGLGACLRVLVMDIFKRTDYFHNQLFPWSTFLINLTGSVLFAFIFWHLHHTELTAIVMVGFIGGYTTFSTFNNELVLLWQRSKLVASLYGIATYLIAMLAGISIMYH